MLWSYFYESQIDFERVYYVLVRIHMIQTYKIITEKINLDKDLFFKKSRLATRGHNYKLYKQHANKLVRINTFSKRIVNDWNGLDSKVVNAEKTQEFKNKLDHFWQDKAFMSPF